MRPCLLVCALSGLVAVVGIAGGCGGTAPVANAHAVAADAETAPQPEGFTGIWKGTIRVTQCGMLRERGRCMAVNNVSFSLIQDGANVSGVYRCAIGTQICRNGNADDSGKITSGRVSGRNIRFSVVIPADVSSCNFTGISESPGQMRGGYNCYQGAGLIEGGMFTVSREGG